MYNGAEIIFFLGIGSVMTTKSDLDDFSANEKKNLFENDEKNWSRRSNLKRIP